MADELWHGVALAAGIQVDYDTKLAGIDGVGNGDETDGYVLGVRGAGDSDSGITVPTMDPLYTEKSQVGASYTERAGAFVRPIPTGLAISWVVQGNGADSGAPDAGACKPFMGLDALIEAAGLDGANGANPIYEYAPRATTVYCTIKLFHGDIAMVFIGCLVETLSFAINGGGNLIATANIRIGKLDTGDVDDGVTFPTIDFGTQDTLAAPVIAGVDMVGFGETRGGAGLTLTVANELVEFEDTSVTITGKRLIQSRRTISINGTLYSATADSDSEWASMIAGSAPTDDLSFQIGPVAGASDVINGIKVELNNLQVWNMKYKEMAEQQAVEIDGRCTSTSAGTEFKLTFN